VKCNCRVPAPELRAAGSGSLPRTFAGSGPELQGEHCLTVDAGGGRVTLWSDGHDLCNNERL
jgi:hypothetical protein